MASRKPDLRPVGPDEKAPPKVTPKSVTEAAQSGTPRELLVAMRDRVARDVENANTHPRDLAALSRRLIEIVNEIAALDARVAEEAEGAGANTPDDEWEAV